MHRSGRHESARHIRKQAFRNAKPGRLLNSGVHFFKSQLRQCRNFVSTQVGSETLSPT
jgi:hypothetical protein